MITDDYYNATLEQINEGRFGNMAKIGALVGSLALGSANPSIAGDFTYPSRPYSSQDMFINNLNMATNSVGYSPYIDLSKFLTATSTNWENIAYGYIRKNETLGHTNKCFGVTQIPRKRLRKELTSLFGTSTSTNLPCYKTYKDSKGILTVGMGINIKPHIKKITFAMGVHDWDTCFNSSKNPLTVEQVRSDPSKVKYIDKKLVDAITANKFSEIVDKCKRSFTDWESIPYCVRIVIVDLGWNRGGMTGFKDFVKAIDEKRWVDAAKELMDSKTYGDGKVGEKGRFYRNAGLILKWARTQDETKYDSAMTYADQTAAKNNEIWGKVKNEKEPKPKWHTITGKTPEEKKTLAQQKSDWEELLKNGGKLEPPKTPKQ